MSSVVPSTMATGLLAMGMWLGGCRQSAGPEMLAISGPQYALAFDAAVDAARAQGMPATLRDRRSGVIETESRIAGSLLEPWRTDNASLNQTLENTLALQRRRARFEFTPLGLNPASDQVPTQPSEPHLDLSQHEGDLVLRVWVFVERAHNAGLRRSTWSRSKTTISQLAVPEGESGLPAGQFWTPVARDLAYERRLMEQVQSALGPAGRPE